jgi:hypothetical protein
MTAYGSSVGSNSRHALFRMSMTGSCSVWNGLDKGPGGAQLEAERLRLAGELVMNVGAVVGPGDQREEIAPPPRSSLTRVETNALIGICLTSWGAAAQPGEWSMGCRRSK